ncbi:MAG TPA: TonB-dependent receptor plug domain-containing protein [Bacteroidales bacterium]|nr:TonB-dependent receptor plug domain-containing protein [Bacteroidales bacterium]
MKRGIILLLVFSLIIAENIEGQKSNKKNIVSGYVTDVNNQPVAGAMILADRQETGVVTSKKGFYKVRITPETRMIGVYSELNGSAETPAEVGTEVNIVLYGNYAIQGFIPALPAEEEMVNVGYGKVKKEDLTTPTGQIDGKNNKYDSYTSIYDMIRGEVPGVQVVGTQILIRGVSSINSSNDPLLVVDGMPVSSIDNISPRQVKSISVLKGADAAIYGTRAAGGVILIDLKGASDR